MIPLRELVPHSRKYNSIALTCMLHGGIFGSAAPPSASPRTMSFKKFSQEEHVASMARVKSSKARKILSALKEEYELLEDTIEEMWPDKKTPVIIAECRNKMQLIVRDGLPIFYKPRDGRWVPSLRFLYKYPGIIKAVRVDKGAIRFVLRGAACA